MANDYPDTSEYPDELAPETDEERLKREEKEREEEQARISEEAAAAAREESAAQAQALSTQMAAEESRAANPRMLTTPTVTPLSNRGRMYIGPNIPDAVISRLVAPGTAQIWYKPDVRPPQMSELQRLQAADRPGTRTIAIIPPIPSETATGATGVSTDDNAAIAADRFAATQEYNKSVSDGEPRTSAFARLSHRLLRGYSPSVQSQLSRNFLGDTTKTRGAMSGPTIKLNEIERTKYADMRSELKAEKKSWQTLRDSLDEAADAEEKRAILGRLATKQTRIKEIESGIKTFESQFTQPTPIQPPPTNKVSSPYREGARIRNKAGIRFIVRNGKPVPVQ